MHAFLLRLPAPPYLQGSFRSRRPLQIPSVGQSFSQSVSCFRLSGKPHFSSAELLPTLFLIANAFHFCILALSMSSILLFDDA